MLSLVGFKEIWMPKIQGSLRKLVESRLQTLNHMLALILYVVLQNIYKAKKLSQSWNFGPNIETTISKMKNLNPMFVLKI